MEGDGPHPIRQHRAIDENAVPGKNLRLAVEGHVLAKLGDRHLRQQRFGRNAAFHQMSRRWRLAHVAASL